MISTAPLTSTGLALSLREVTKTYELGDTRIDALKSVSLDIEQDEIVALVGPSGSGKTTLCSIAGGLLTPTHGTITVGGDDIGSLTPRQLTSFRRQQVGFVFQSINLVPFLTARENLLVLDRVVGGERRAARERADELLTELGLGHRADNLPRQLSGGERQRVAIARAMMNRPQLVLFDEPTSALDTELGEQIMTLIRTETKRQGTAAIVVTHDERATRFTDRTVRILDGRLDDAGQAPTG